ncbi:MAG: hypothetical protein ACOX8S_09345 [Christensenellales bacterium]|jgi:hypothetical protein
MIPMHFPKLSCFERRGEACTIASPHAMGKLKNPEDAGVFFGESAVLSQSKATAFWPDGSVKWLLTHFLADLPANKGSDDYRIELRKAELSGAAVKTAKAEKGEGGCLVIDTGALNLVLGSPGEEPIRSASYGDVSFSQGEVQGPSFKTGGKEYAALVGNDGWEIVENGPVRVLAVTKGKHKGKDGECLDFHLQIYAYAGKPYVQLEYRFINLEKDAPLYPLTAMQIAIKPKTKGESCTIAHSNYATRYNKSNGEDISSLIDATFLKYLSNEQICEISMGTYFADWRDKNRGVAVTMFQAYQNFPKGFDASSKGINAQIIPGVWGNIDVHRGMAKTHKMLLHFHKADSPVEGEVGFRSLQYNMPDKPVIGWRAYKDAGLYEEYLGEKRQMNVELYLKALGESTARAFGMMHWGDAPDSGYTLQGRAQGDYVWTNNEYDFPHQCMIEFARTGDRAYMDKLLVAAEHWRDVDVCHSCDDPLKQGGQVIHSKDHTSSNCVPSHEWVEGLWDYYHLTGDEFAKEVVMGIADNIRRVLLEKIFPMERYTAAREAGWALRSFCAMYDETADEQWLEYCERIVDYFEKWTDEYGAWLQPYTDHTMVRVPFMISVACVSLHMYYKIRPNERIKKLILGAIDDVLENCFTYDGTLYYKELPSLQRSGTNPIIMHALTLCYYLSGEKKYLDAGLNFFKLAVFYGEAPALSLGKIGDKDSVICSGQSPKRFAQSYPCISIYYKAAMDNDMLPNELATLAPWR